MSTGDVNLWDVGRDVVEVMSEGAALWSPGVLRWNARPTEYQANLVLNMVGGYQGEMAAIGGGRSG